MDTAEVTLRLDRGVAERLRRDPAERTRYEALLGLAAAARTPAEVEQAVRLFTAPPVERPRLLAEMLDQAFGPEPARALSGGAAWAAAVCRALSADAPRSAAAPQAAGDPPSAPDEGLLAAVPQARGEGRKATSARRSHALRSPLGVSALLLLTLGGGAMALRHHLVTSEEPALAGAADGPGRLPDLPNPAGLGGAVPDDADPEDTPAPHAAADAPHVGAPATRPGAPPPPSDPTVDPEPTGPSPADGLRARAVDPDAPTRAVGAGREVPRREAAPAEAPGSSTAPGALSAGTEASPDLFVSTAPSLVTVGSPAGSSRVAKTGGGPDAAGGAPPGLGEEVLTSRPGAAGRLTGVVVHHRAGSPAAERAARLVAAEVRGAGLDRAAVRPVPAVPARRVIRFGRREDEAAAERLALRLRERWQHRWRVEASTGLDPARPTPLLEVWLPHR